MYKISNKNIVIYSFNTIILLSLSEIIVSILLVIIGINSKDIVNNQYYNLLANIIIAIFAILIFISFVFKKMSFAPFLGILLLLFQFNAYGFPDTISFPILVGIVSFVILT